jgi:hypothetical protein
MRKDEEPQFFVSTLPWALTVSLGMVSFGLFVACAVYLALLLW